MIVGQTTGGAPFWTSSFTLAPSSGSSAALSLCSGPLAFPHVLLKAGTLACISPFHTDPQTTSFPVPKAACL